MLCSPIDYAGVAVPDGQNNEAQLAREEDNDDDEDWEDGDDGEEHEEQVAEEREGQRNPGVVEPMRPQAGGGNVPPPRFPNAPVANNDAAPVNNNNDPDADMEQIDVELHVAMDELLGIRGPFPFLLRNILWLIAFNAAYLGLFAFIPYR